MAFDNGPDLGVQEHGSGSCLAHPKPQTGSGDLVPAQADDFVLAAAGQHDKAYDVDLAALRRRDGFDTCATIKYATKPIKLHPGEETGDLLSRTGSDAPCRVRGDIPAGGRVIEDVAKGLQVPRSDLSDRAAQRIAATRRPVSAKCWTSSISRGLPRTGRSR